MKKGGHLKAATMEEIRSLWRYYHKMRDRVFGYSASYFSYTDYDDVNIVNELPSWQELLSKQLLLTGKMMMNIKIRCIIIIKNNESDNIKKKTTSDCIKYKSYFCK